MATIDIGRVAVVSSIDPSAVTTTAPFLLTMLSASTIIGASTRPTVTMAESAITPRVRSAIKAVASGIDVTK